MTRTISITQWLATHVINLHILIPLQIELGPSEFLMGAYGTRGPFTNSPADVVTSLTLVTNARSYGPFGHGGGRPFQVPMQGNSSIVGFFGCAGSYIDAIGVYVKPGDQQQHKAMEQEVRLRLLKIIIRTFHTRLCNH